MSNFVSRKNTAAGKLAGGKQTGSFNNSLDGEAGSRGGLDDTDYITGGNNIAALGFGAGSAWTDGRNNIATGNYGSAAESTAVRIGGHRCETHGCRGAVSGTQAGREPPFF